MRRNERDVGVRGGGWNGACVGRRYGVPFREVVPQPIFLYLVDGLPDGAVMISLLIIGMCLGAVFAAPVGPVGLMAAVRAGQGWWRNAYAIAAGAALADTVLSVVAVAGVGMFWFIGDSARLAASGAEPIVACAAAIVMITMAWSLWSSSDMVAREGRAMMGFGIGFFATVAHPANLAAFAAAYAWLRAYHHVQVIGMLDVLVFGGGVLLGASLAWSGFMVALRWLLQRWEVQRSFWLFRRGVALGLILVALAVIYGGFSGR